MLPPHNSAPGNGREAKNKDEMNTTGQSGSSNTGPPREPSTQETLSAVSGSSDPPRVRFSEDTTTRPDLTTAIDENRFGSAVTPLSGQKPPPTRPAQNRARGYSLRRVLFSQHLVKQNEQANTEVELAPAPSPTIQTARSTVTTDKGSSVVVVEHSPLEHSDPVKSSLSSKSRGALHFSRKTIAKRKKKRGLPPVVRQGLQYLEALQARLFGPPVLPPSTSGRHVRINTTSSYKQNDERTGRPYISNIIRSCKYTPWNFVPKQLWAQFGKLANFYFLCVSILQMIPGLSTTGTYTTIIPLLIFVSISMAKEGYDDLRRFRLDKEENERLAHVLDANFLRDGLLTKDESNTISRDSGAWRKEAWHNIKVGDVLLLERDDAIPADVVLIYSSGMEHAAHVETKSLDGETNLKLKKPLSVLQSRARTAAAAVNMDAEFVVEDPNLDLYRFEGRVTIAGQTLPLGLGEVLYRGSVLRNTPSALGVVVYSGEECKIRMNANKNPRVKAPALQGKVNRVVAIVAGLVFFLATVETFCYQIWRNQRANRLWYLRRAQVPFGQILTSFIIMFNTMLPLSLYVSLEIVKVAQMFLMNDVDMYDPESDTPMEARTSNLNEELGQVSYIFSDKTGTLTNNQMKFRKMSVAGTAWLHDHDLIEDASNRQEKLLHKKRAVNGKQKHKKHLRAGTPTSRAQVSGRSLSTSRPSGLADHLSTLPDGRDFLHTGKTDDLLDYIYYRPHSLFAKKARFFILCLALCHTAIPEKDGHGDINFQAASPDELALVTAAQELGYIVTDRQTGTMTVKSYRDGDDEEGSYETYEILDVIEFSSARKRMSILVRFPDSRVCLICKGADSIIRKLLKQADMAATLVEDIKRKTDMRKSMEAQIALRRKSIQAERASVSAPRRASTLGPTIGANISRKSSVQLERRGSVRDSIDLWLREREQGATIPRKSSVHYAPRLSEAISPSESTRPSTTSTDIPRSSFESGYFRDFIDEAIVVNDRAVFERCFNHIDDFATEGLRTLVYGHRFVEEQDYQQWKEKFHAASTSLVDRQGKIERAAELIEQQLELTGATAIEDKLQTGVPDAIERFRRAGIKMWMLTGDKRETAINIGYSCHLIKDYSTVTVLDHEQGDLPNKIASALDRIQTKELAHSVLVVDGQTLTFIECDAALMDTFADLAIATDSVICCRASPSQKANLVKIVRTQVRGSVTLAIGDGANDIAMIQEAHVGIGIAGKEGLQASRTSDYSIAQFRFLVKLLFVHGRWNYVRVCKYTLGTFWKEMIFYLIQAIYQRYAGYTGTSLYEPWTMSMFNTLFTSLPVIFMGVFEKDLSATTLVAVPELYTYGHQNRGFNIPRYFRWATLGTVEAVLVFYLAYGLYGCALLTDENYLYPLGTLAFTSCVTLISFKLQFFELHNKSITAGLAIFLSVGGWWLWNLLMSGLYPKHDKVYQVYHSLLYKFGRNTLWWLVVILIVMAISILELSLKCVKSVFFPTDVEMFQILERDIDVKRRLEQSAADLLQAGWHRGTKKSSLEILRDEEEEARREAEIQEILDRPRTMDRTSSPVVVSAPPDENPKLGGFRKRMSWTPIDFEGIRVKDYVSKDDRRSPSPSTRKSTEIGTLSRRGVGSARRQSMK